MPTLTIDVRELPGRLAELVSAAANGTEVVVTDGPATARLVSLPPADPPPAGRREFVFNMHAGLVEVRDDFDDYIDEEDFLRGDF